ncbi:MAG: discoidin domain-containing protein [Verrucomicrobiota bacterium]
MNFTRLVLLAVLCGSTGAIDGHAMDKVLFIRGGSGTVGFFEGGSDEQGADVFNYATNNGNHGWGEFASALEAEGFEIEQMSEDPVSGGVPTPVPLDTMNLSQYSVIVFGSNNAEYTTAQVDALVSYIQNGGGALFISDANFGQNWGDAPESDTRFLTRFGLTMNQDLGTYSIRRNNEFVAPNHPILNGVDTFDGEGVSPITVSSSVSGVTSTILTQARNTVRRNTGASQGPSEAVTSSDASLVIATFGTGRIAGHFDRNTFFNLNGAGTNINRFENEAYARNLINWLAGNPDFNPVTDNYAPRGHFLSLNAGSSTQVTIPLVLQVEATDYDGSVSSVDLYLNDQFIQRDSSSPYQWNIQTLSPGTHTLRARLTDDSGATTDVMRTVVVEDPADTEQPLDRSAWVLSANANNTDVNNAIDGDESTRWATQAFQVPGQKFSMDLGQRQLIQRIVMTSANNPEDYPRGYILSGSDDGVNYTQIMTGAGTNPDTEIILSQPVTYRYLEIEQTGSSSNRWWSIHELNIYQPAASAVLPQSSWNQFYFGEDLNDPAKELTHWGPSVDFDGDGMNNLLEFALGTSPVDATSIERPSFATAFDSQDGRRTLNLTFRRWTSDNGLVYTIQAGEDLNSLAEVLSPVEVGSPVSNSDGTETVTLQVKAPVSAEHYFMRLRVEESP